MKKFEELEMQFIYASRNGRLNNLHFLVGGSLFQLTQFNLNEHSNNIKESYIDEIIDFINYGSYNVEFEKIDFNQLIDKLQLMSFDEFLILEREVFMFWNKQQLIEIAFTINKSFNDDFSKQLLINSLV